MSIMELGALGEFVGAIAVFATLGYLAVQVRQSARSTQSNAIAQAASDHIANMRCIAEVPALAEVVDKAQRGQELESRELLQLTAWFSCLLRGAETHVQMAKLGVVPEFEAPWKDILRAMLQPDGPYGRNPVARPMMESYIGSRTFRTWLDQQVLS